MPWSVEAGHGLRGPCEDLDAGDDAGGIVARLHTALQAPVMVAGKSLSVGASIGVAATDPAAEHSAERLLHDADMAMYAAKRSGGRQHHVFSSAQMGGYLADLQRALPTAQRHELQVHYQPIVATGDGRMTGVEALLR